MSSLGSFVSIAAGCSNRLSYLPLRMDYRDGPGPEDNRPKKDMLKNIGFPSCHKHVKNPRTNQLWNYVPSCHKPNNKHEQTNYGNFFKAEIPSRSQHGSSLSQRDETSGAGDGRDLHGTSSVHQGTRPHCQPAGGSKR